MKKRIIAVTLATLMILSAVLILVPPVASDGGGSSPSSRGVKSVLFWDGAESYAPSAYFDYRLAITGYGATFTRVTSMPSLAYMQQFDLVFYYTASMFGNMFPRNNEWPRMQQYLDAGGSMVWNGCLAGYCALNYYGLSFQNNYFGAQWATYHYFSGYNHNMVGTNGNLEITGNWYINYNHPEIWLNYPFHDNMRPVNGGVREMYCQSYSSYATMISKETTVYQTVLWTFDLNSIDTPQIQVALMTKVLDWFSGGIPANVRLEPQSLNLESMGNWVSVKIESFPDNPEYSAMDVDGSSIAVGGVGVDLKFGTWNDNRFIGKVDRLLVEDAIGTPGDEVEVEVTGKLNDGTGFMGNAVIKAL